MMYLVVDKYDENYFVRKDIAKSFAAKKADVLNATVRVYSNCGLVAIFDENGNEVTND